MHVLLINTCEHQVRAYACMTPPTACCFFGERSALALGAAFRLSSGATSRTRNTIGMLPEVGAAGMLGFKPGAAYNLRQTVTLD